MKNKNCLLYYKVLKSLFPDVGYAEGKFLRDLKAQIRQYSITHPNCTYEEVENFFGSAQEVAFDFIESKGIDNVYFSVKRTKLLRYIAIGAVVLMLLIFFTNLFFWFSAYINFANDSVYEKVITIEETEVNED